MGRKHRKHTHDAANRMRCDMDAGFRAFMEAHNAAQTEAEAEPDAIQPDEDFAERFLIGMRRELGVRE